MTPLFSLPLRLVAFSLWFAAEVVKSSYAVLRDVLTTGRRSRPRVVDMPLESELDGHVTLIASLITLTPGTLTLGVTRGGNGARHLAVHSMYHPDAASALADLRDMEKRMLHAFTWKGRS
ncbi:Na+/H+ antiporter subunit E [Streptomyces spiramenti]|uniref:Na+/H+ antiporter subunit E n=1 Tax=Streptomyces spiramenti TaxID=2720606 RepID=A0ABX1ACD5_9ACTN|nr:Na+/H+ antiporter subunit E [Streptomyces spiramenti]NJP64853.1 Na+/H+ antiporter subunit E [Streptomyces spiramenti]